MKLLRHSNREEYLTKHYAVGYSKIVRRLFRRAPPNVDFNMDDITMLSIDG